MKKKWISILHWFTTVQHTNSNVTRIRVAICIQEESFFKYWSFLGLRLSFNHLLHIMYKSPNNRQCQSSRSGILSYLWGQPYLISYVYWCGKIRSLRFVQFLGRTLHCAKVEKENCARGSQLMVTSWCGHSLTSHFQSLALWLPWEMDENLQLWAKISPFLLSCVLEYFHVARYTKHWTLSGTVTHADHTAAQTIRYCF